jgi:hypothetical protein
MRILSENRLRHCAVASLSALVGCSAVWFYTAHESQTIKATDLAYSWRTIQVFATAVFTTGVWCYRISGWRHDEDAVSERAAGVLFLVGSLTAVSCVAPLLAGIQSALTIGDWTLLSFAVAALWTAYSSYVRLRRQADAGARPPKGTRT